MATLGIATLGTEVDLDGLDSGLDDAEGKTKGWASGLSGNIQGLLGGIVVGGALAAAGAVIGIGAAAFDVANQFQGATNTIQAQLGITGEEAQRLGEVVSDVYANNFGGSIAEVGQAVTETVRQLGGLGVTADQEIQKVTESAFALRDAFGIEVPESLSAVRTLMSEFGLSSTEAFDLITIGFQEIPQFAQDGLDSIGEYSNLFSDAGFDAGEFFSILETGAAGGVLGTDKIADAVKEMNIRLNEGAAGVSEAFDSIGLDFDEIQGSVASGDETWADYFDNIVGGLQGIEDPILRNQAQVAIFGTMAEDLGPSFLDGLDPAKRSLDDVAGRTEGLNVQYDNLGDIISGFGRRAQVAIRPLGDILLNLARRAMPLVERAFSWFEDTLVPMIEFVADELDGFLRGFIANIQDGMDPVEAIIDAFLNWTQTAENLGVVAWDVGGVIWDLWQSVKEFVGPIWDAITGFVSWKDILIIVGGVIAATIIPIIYGLITTFAPIIAGILAIVGIVSLLRNAWENDWLGIRTELMETWEGAIQPALTELFAWLKDRIPPALAQLRQFWENVLLPGIRMVADFISANVVPLISDLIGIYIAGLKLELQALGQFWENVLLPAIQRVWTWISGTLVPYLSGTLLPMLRDTLTAALETLAGFWENTLLPAINAVWDFVQGSVIPLFQAVADLFNAVLSLALTALAGLWQNVLLPALTDVWEFIDANLMPIFNDIRDFLADNLGPALQAVADGALKAFYNGIAALEGIIASAIGWIQSLIDKLNNITLPDILTPGSPTPFELGLRGINSAGRELVDVLSDVNDEMARGRSASNRLGTSAAGGFDPDQILPGGGEITFPERLLQLLKDGSGSREMTMNVYSNAPVSTVIEDWGLLEALLSA